MMGPVAYLPTLVGLKLSGDSASGFGDGQALTSFILAAWAFLLGRDLDDVPRVAYSFSIAAVALSPTMPGSSLFAFSPALTYNRYGYAFLGLILLECYRAWNRSDSAGGLSTGIILALLAFLKLPYFIAGMAIVGFLARFGRQKPSRWIALAVSSALVGMAFMAYLRLQAVAVWRDLALTMAARHIDFFRLYNVNMILLEAGMVLILGAGGAAFLRSRGLVEDAKALSVMVIVVVCCSIFLLVCSAQQLGLSIAPLVLILVVDAMMVHETWTAVPQNHALHNISVAGATVFVAIPLLSLVITLIFGIALKGFIQPPLHGCPRVAFLLARREDLGYSQFVEEGLQLAQANRRADEHVMSLDFSNPFSFGLGIAPA
jgi:hypothetical protein